MCLLCTMTVSAACVMDLTLDNIHPAALLPQPILEEVRAEKMERARLGSGPGYQRTIP